ncbi:MAG: MBL fold metallo-hydrolase [Christensenellales bacterium]|jgi:ribonuclease BN (tRNA processing enzyme)
MKLTALGVNGPYPAPGGACSGYLVESESGDTKLLLECGAGTLARLTQHADIADISGIVLSHLHYDHISDMLVVKYMLQFTKLMRNIPVLAPNSPAHVRAMLDDAKLDFLVPRDMTIGEMRLSFVPATHPVPAVSVKIECDGAVFVYTGDTNQNAQIELFSDGADLLLADAGLTDAQWSPKSPHLSAKLCGELARNARVGALLLTHLYPGIDQDALLDEARASYPAAQIAEAGATYLI